MYRLRKVFFFLLILFKSNPDRLRAEFEGGVRGGEGEGAEIIIFPRGKLPIYRINIFRVVNA